MKKKSPKGKKPTITVNNRIQSFGDEENGKIRINVKRHFIPYEKLGKGYEEYRHKSKSPVEELADTVYHETYHAKNPKATEKKTYAITRKAMKEMTYAEKEKLAAKVRNKKNHYQQGALKRKFKMKPGKVEPGTYISKMNESKVHKKTNPAKASNFKLGVEALI